MQLQFTKGHILYTLSNNSGYNCTITHFYRIRECMIKIFMGEGGGGGGRDGGWGGGSNELMLEVGWWGSLRDLSRNILKQGVGKGKSGS